MVGSWGLQKCQAECDHWWVSREDYVRWACLWADADSNDQILYLQGKPRSMYRKVSHSSVCSPENLDVGENWRGMSIASQESVSRLPNLHSMAKELYLCHYHQYHQASSWALLYICSQKNSSALHQAMQTKSYHPALKLSSLSSQGYREGERTPFPNWLPCLCPSAPLHHSCFDLLPPNSGFEPKVLTKAGGSFRD